MRVFVKFIRLRMISLAAMTAILFSAAATAANTTVNQAASVTDINHMIVDVKPVDPESGSVEEALTYADKLKSIANALRTKYTVIIASGSGQSSLHSMVTTKIKAIMTAIETERKNLVEMVMLESATNTTHPEKLDSIIEALETQRMALADLINPLAEQADKNASENASENENAKPAAADKAPFHYAK